MRICMIYDGDYPWDVRVWKMTTSLTHQGHEVHLVCRNLAQRPNDETLERVRIHRMPALPNRRLNSLLTFPAFFNPLWLKRIGSIVKQSHIELIIVRDLPLALAAGVVGKRYQTPVILDMAEDYPAMLRDVWKFEGVRLQNFLVRNPFLAKMVEYLATRLADHIVVVIDEAKERLIKTGLRADKISVVMNTPKVEMINFPPEWQAPHHEGRRLSMVFVGGLEPMRGLDETFEMVAVAVRRMPSLYFTIVGGGRWEEELKEKACRLGIEANVAFTGQQDYQKALFQVQQSDIGLIPHRVTAHTNATIPNKLFEYMLLGKPVLATNMIPVRRIIQECECGLVYQDKEEGVQALAQLQDGNLRGRLGGNGRKAVLKRYNWSRDADTLMQTVSKVTNWRRQVSEIPSVS